ncbi:hypothetical protein SAMN05444358_102253 [Ruegeria halocynthiae]|uniref:Uncharacterized protein n=1 Tax=Ruegeria halocynthiae TaxID=985054 RepID=A0A1H2YET4_9RHOB|nr:hypothetical protein SAMN05444358_102253 [Ruegeria halocynthiae]
MEVSGATKLKALECENAKLNWWLADRLLDNITQCLFCRLDGDNGTELTRRAILKWANGNGNDWHSIDTGKLQRKFFIV